MRRDILEALGGYSESKDTLRVEDYDLWVRMYAAGYRGFNTQEILYSMRDDRNAISRRTFQSRINESKVHFESREGVWLQKEGLPLFCHSNYKKARARNSYTKLRISIALIVSNCPRKDSIMKPIHSHLLPSDGAWGRGAQLAGAARRHRL